MEIWINALGRMKHRHRKERSAIQPQGTKVSADPLAPPVALDAGPAEAEPSSLRDKRETDRFYARLSLDAMDQRLIDSLSDCQLRFDFAFRGWEPSRPASTRSAEDGMVHAALRLLFSVAPEDRGAAAVEHAIRAARKMVGRQQWPVGTDRDAIEESAAALLRDYVAAFGTDGNTVAIDLELSSRFVDPTMELDVTIARVDFLDEDREAVELINFDTSPKMEHRHAISNDPMVWAWLVVAANYYPVPIARVRNQGVRLGKEEVWELNEGDVERVTDSLNEFVRPIMLEPKATPGPWCGSCGYEHVCSASGRLSLDELRERAA